MCAGTSSGKVLLIDTTDYKVKVVHNIANSVGQCQAVSKLCYSASGQLYIVCFFKLQNKAYCFKLRLSLENVYCDVVGLYNTEYPYDHYENFVVNNSCNGCHKSLST